VQDTGDGDDIDEENPGGERHSRSAADVVKALREAAHNLVRHGEHYAGNGIFRGGGGTTPADGPKGLTVNSSTEKGREPEPVNATEGGAEP
jgi:hypothetical protein